MNVFGLLVGFSILHSDLLAVGLVFNLYPVVTCFARSAHAGVVSYKHDSNVWNKTQLIWKLISREMWNLIVFQKWFFICMPNNFQWFSSLKRAFCTCLPNSWHVNVCVPAFIYMRSYTSNDLQRKNWRLAEDWTTDFYAQVFGSFWKVALNY